MNLSHRLGIPRLTKLQSIAPSMPVANKPWLPKVQRGLTEIEIQVVVIHSVDIVQSCTARADGNLVYNLSTHSAAWS